MSLVIRDSVVKTGSLLVTNEDIVSKFNGDSDGALEFLESIGRHERYWFNGLNENTLTVGAEVASEVLRRNNLTGEDVDLIAFCSQYPEYTMPTQSLIIHNHIKGKSKCVTLDINANCLGMLRGLDTVNRYFNDKEGDCKRALLIGSDYMSKFTNSNELVTLGSFADSACAILLEYTDDINEGVIGSSDRTISGEAYGCMFPESGLSNIEKTSGKFVKTSWTNPDTSISMNAMKEALDDILIKHSMSVSDIDWYCGSQFAEPFFKSVADICNIPQSRGIYVGNKYGYTGTSSPFMALHEGIKDGRIKKGDVVFLTTVGVGISICSMLLRV